MPPKKSSKMSSVETEGSPAAETVDKKIKTKRAAAAAAASAAASAADINVENESANSENDELVTPDQFQKSNVNKKRGRKPKGGKIMTNLVSSISDISEIPNIILHLKCHMSDLKTNDTIVNYDYSPSIEDIESYTSVSAIINGSDIISTFNTNDDNDDYSNSEIEDYNSANPKMQFNNQNDMNSKSKAQQFHSNNNGIITSKQINNTLPISKNQTLETPLHKDNIVQQDSSKINILNEKMNKEISKKINKLKLSFHNGESVQTKGNHKSACFWDTCEFDSPIHYIPANIINDTFQVYGCFCSPECAIAYLLKEQLDTSTKFERLHLIQLLYGGVSQYGKGLKPAPSPHFLLDKYYGNLTIQEYRQLFKSQQMIYIVNKPLTHILPELYEDNNDFLVNSKVIPTNNMKLKKRYKTMIIQNND
jgi:hypothetical protein